MFPPALSGGVVFRRKVLPPMSEMYRLCHSLGCRRTTAAWFSGFSAGQPMPDVGDPRCTQRCPTGRASVARIALAGEKVGGKTGPPRWGRRARMLGRTRQGVNLELARSTAARSSASKNTGRYRRADRRSLKARLKALLSGQTCAVLQAKTPRVATSTCAGRIDFDVWAGRWSVVGVFGARHLGGMLFDPLTV